MSEVVAAKKENKRPDNRGMDEKPLTDQELRLVDAYWRASNYLSVGQIYLLDTPCCANH